MAGFFSKLKDGVAKTADKAQLTLEVTKLSSQINGIKKDIDALYTQIGEQVYQAYAQGDLSLAEAEIVRHGQAIGQHQDTITELEAKIRELRNEKTCPDCSTVVAADIRFCSSCGHKFDFTPPPAAVEPGAEAPVEGSQEQVLILEPELEAELASEEERIRADEPCASCGEPVAPGVRYCTHCGHDQQAVE
ncbi:zinc ribbon domain-containing protein [Gorillibacterium sp. CAU 1737]|uniref:zinc ribbon domain-containing protein n=1 Tax=Gorillibacterium sp. CAU 1737 TaxID=3140362 RepID=UPI0032601074